MRPLRFLLLIFLPLCLLFACSAAYAQSSVLPVLRLTVDPGGFLQVLESRDHTFRAEGGSLSILVPDGYRGEYGPAESMESLPLAYIRGRGNSTWLNRKKPFRFRLQSGADLLGMGSNKHWVLLAEAIDGSMLRNRLMSYAGRKFGLAYTPKMVPLELYVNGEYLGCYVLSQQVRKGKTRVAIGEEGFLLSMSPYEDEPGENVLNTSRGVRFLCEDPVFFSSDPSDDVAVPARREEIAAFLQRTEDAVYSEETETSGIPCAEYMDLHSAAKYWWLEEFFMNGDAAFTPSTYLYVTEGRLYWGPLWDFDLSIPSSASPEGLNNVRMPWFDHLRAYSPSFRKILAEEWALLRPILLDAARDGGIIDLWAEEIRPAWERNRAAGFADESLEQDDLSAQAERIKDWFRRRIDWIDSHLDSALAETRVEIYFFADGQYLSTVRLPLPSGRLTRSDFPDAPLKDGFAFSGWRTETGVLLREGDQPETDVVATPSYVPAE